MKNILKTLGLTIGSVAFLVGCNVTTSGMTSDHLTSGNNIASGDQTSQNDKSVTSDKTNENSSSKGTSTSSSVVIPTAVEFLEGLKSYQANIKNTYYSIDYYGKSNYYFNAIHSSYEPLTGGKIALGEKGIWSWKKAKSTKAFTLGQMDTPMNVSDFTTVSEYYLPFDVLISTADSWKPVAGYKTVYEITEDDESGVLDVLPNFASYFNSSGVEYYATLARMQIYGPDKATISLNMTQVKNGKKSYSTGVRVYFTDVGTNAPIDMPQDIDIEKPTDWPTEVSDAFKTLYGDDFTLPFSDKFTIGFSSSVNNDSNGNVSSLVCSDLLSGDISTDLSTALLLNGFTKNTEASNSYTSEAGFTVNAFDKVVAPATDTEMDKVARVLVYFQDLTYTDYEEQYPNGIFTLQFILVQDPFSSTDISKINNFIGLKALKKDGTAIFPSLPFILNLNAIRFDDMTTAATNYYQIQFDFYFIIEGKFNNDANALSSLTNYIDSLTTAGFTWTDGDANDSITTAADDLDTNNTVRLNLADARYKNTNGVSLIIKIGTENQQGQVTRDGSFMIYMMAA